MKKLVALFLTLVVLLSFGLDVKAQEIRKGDFDLLWMLRPPTQAEMDALAENLRLTEEQRADMNRKHERYTADIRQLYERYPEARQDLVRALQERPQPDPAQVENALKELDRLHSTILDREMQLWNALSNNLTQEQTEEFWRLFGTRRIQRAEEREPSEFFR